MTIRESSSKLRFYDLKADGDKVQILAQIQSVCLTEFKVPTD